jgi:hypothetical protein
MSSKEGVLTTLNQREPDRTPLYFFCSCLVSKVKTRVAKQQTAPKPKASWALDQCRSSRRVGKNMVKENL